MKRVYVQPSDDILRALRSRGYAAELTKLSDYYHTDFVNDPRPQIIEAMATLAYKE